MRLPTSAGSHGADHDVGYPSVARDEMLRVPAHRLVLLWSAVAIASVLGKLLANEFDVGRWLSAPVLVSIAVTVGLVGMLALSRRQEASAAARWPLSERRRAVAPWN